MNLIAPGYFTSKHSPRQIKPLDSLINRCRSDNNQQFQKQTIQCLSEDMDQLKNLNSPYKNLECEEVSLIESLEEREGQINFSSNNEKSLRNLPIKSKNFDEVI